MILLKKRELASGKPSAVSSLGKGSDKIFQRSFASAKVFASYFSRKTFIVVTQWIAFHVLFRVRKIYVEVKHRALSNPHSKNVILAVRGRGEVKKQGASFFLRRISSEE